MTRHRLKIEVRESTIVVRGWRGGELAREAGCRPIFSGSAGGWILDRARLSDLQAHLEHRRIAVTFTEAGVVK